MSQQRLSETALKLLELAKPKYIKGRWRKPLISNRELAVSRKALLLQGEYWPPKPLVNRSADKPFKLHAWERGKTREETIKENMAKMPEMIAEYRRSVYELREKTRAKKKLSEEDEYLYATGQKEMMSKQTKKVEKKKWRKK